MEVKGKIKLINSTKEFGANGFKKRELVVETSEDYPQNLLIEFVQDKCSVLDNYKNNDNVIISINLRGREWENAEGKIKYFNSLQGWKISKDNGIQVDEHITPVPSNLNAEANGGDLPF